MPIFNWVEDNASRGATIHRLGRRAQSTYRKSWKIFGTNDDREVHNDVNVTLWTQYLYWQYPGQPLNQLRAESYTLEYLGDQAWQLDVSYTSQGAENDEEREPLRRSRSFETGGATQHITQGHPIGSGESLDFERRFPEGAANQSGAIGVSDDSVSGVDVIVPQLTWTETYDVPSQYVTSAYMVQMHKLTGTVNDDVFRGFAAGEVLFLGGSGTHQWDADKGDGPWSLSYKFSASPNAGQNASLPEISIGSITGVTKGGHEYLWVRYESDVDQSSLIRKPKAVYVNKVYRDGDFSTLGIGVT